MEIYILLGFCLLLVCAFEFINGFHDTANAVAPVIYTHSLSPRKSVLLAAIFNFLGVILGGIGVAMGIIHLLPLDMIANQPVAFGICIVLSLLISAIIWNLGTWYFGIPASSSHTLIGSILGISLVLMYINTQVELPIKKVTEVFESLFLSPMIGFFLAFGAMHILHLYIKGHSFFKNPGRHWNKYPKLWIRGSLIGSSALVSFAHGSNDGQKGVGLAMLILILLAPTYFAINPNMDTTLVASSIQNIEAKLLQIDTSTISKEEKEKVQMAIIHVQEIESILEKGRDPQNGTLSLERIPESDRMQLRAYVLDIQKEYRDLSKGSLSLIPSAQASNGSPLEEISPDIAKIMSVTDYAPWWVIAMISLSLGLGTMIGWKRIVVTIGEKIGKGRLSYAQGTVASIMTAVTISSASHLGLPVSTTHIMSSGVAGTAAHEYGKHGLQGDTIKSILLAWILTLPISTVLSGSIFLILRYFFQL